MLSGSSSTNQGVRCHCGILAVQKTSWTTQNPGRRFVACKLYNPETKMCGCRFFKWIDEDITEWQTKLINELLNENKCSKSEVPMKKPMKIDDGMPQSKYNKLTFELQSMKKNLKHIKIILGMIFIGVVLVLVK
ncbi:hypothetical protein RND81_01G167200 [Saponaria officinalis]|uniref:GRF-type domain-containing protein n=1 Tax=Saponaria officinalis TaxID=3572 RepID=A0AAW1NGJ7_SAPOF